jgi:hypothetical protein
VVRSQLFTQEPPFAENGLHSRLLIQSGRTTGVAKKNRRLLAREGMLPGIRSMQERARSTPGTSIFAAAALIGLAGCAEFAEVLLEDPGHCHGCDWIIQEWDDPGWSTHNSDPYATEELCERALAEQSRKSPDRGHRCIYEGDLWSEEESPAKPSAFCYGCDWVVEMKEFATWERAETATHHTEGVCQQALWHLQKENPSREYRCTNLDM